MARAGEALFAPAPKHSQRKGKVIDITPNKTVNFSFRLTLADKKKLQLLAKKSGLTMTDYIMWSALNKPIIILPGLDELAYQLKAIGNNLNQLTRRANAGETRVVSLRETEQRLGDIWKELMEALKEVC